MLELFECVIVGAGASDLFKDLCHATVMLLLAHSALPTEELGELGRLSHQPVDWSLNDRTRGATIRADLGAAAVDIARVRMRVHGAVAKGTAPFDVFGGLVGDDVSF